MSHFKIDTQQLIDYSLKLQKINDIALPMAVQNTFNAVTRDVKVKTLKQTTEQMFDIQKKTFFTANSGYKPHKAKEFNYNLNKISSEVMILKSNKPNEKATEQLAQQPTAGSVKRSINPLGNKPQKKSVVDILSKKPEIVEWDSANPEKSYFQYSRAALRANRRKAPMILAKNGRGSVHRVKKAKLRKPTKRDPRRIVIQLQNIASYKKGGNVNLKKKAPFLSMALAKSVKTMGNTEFIKQAERQFQRALKK